MQDITNGFLKKTYTMQQIRHRQMLLKQYLNQKFFNGPTVPLSKEDEEWITSLGEEFFGQFNHSNTNTQFDMIEQGIKKISPLVIYIPFEMDAEEVNKLGLWLRKEFNPSVVFETKLDPSLIGGCALSWKGVLRDYSLRAKIQSEQEEILASLKSSMK